MYIHTTAFAESAAVTVKELLRIYHIQIVFAADISDFCKRFFSRNIPVWQADPLRVAAATEPGRGGLYIAGPGCGMPAAPVLSGNC